MFSMIWGIFFFLRCKEIGIKSWKIWNWNGITEKRALGFRVRILDSIQCMHNKKKEEIFWDNSYNKKVYIERFWGRFFEYYVKQMVHWFDKYSTLNKSMSIRMYTIYVYVYAWGKTIGIIIELLYILSRFSFYFLNKLQNKVLKFMHK